MGWFVIWNLQGVGRATASISSLQNKAEQAIGELLLAQNALANADTSASEESFGKAQAYLQEAQQELSDALSAQKYVLSVIDVTNTVDSGRNLLNAASELTEAGMHMSRAVAPFLEAQKSVLPSSPAPDNKNVTLVDAMKVSVVEVDGAIANLEKAEKLLKDVNSPALPKDVQQQVEVMKTSIPRIREILQHIREQSSTYMHLLGADHDRQYLILFANNHELRPVGGFIGTIALVNVDQGRVEAINVQSVYDPDGQLHDFIAPPDPLLPIVDRWYLRDANWFVDYKVSAKKVAEFFEKEGGPTVDGVIMMNPSVISRLLRITGPISVPGYETVVSADNFVQVTQDQVTYNYDREENRPKQFLADLTPILLTKLFAQPSSDTDVGKVRILASLAESLQRKELLLYFKDPEAQAQLEANGWAGRYPEKAQGFLSINNANIGGHKSDQFMSQDVDYDTHITHDGDVDVTLTIRRTHHGPEEKLDQDYPDGEDPAFKNNVVYERVLVPEGAELLEGKGFAQPGDVPTTVIREADVPLVPDADIAAWQVNQHRHVSGTTIGSEAGYTFFANWIITKPGETSTAVYRYRLPKHALMPGIFSPAQSYSTYIGKQPGDERTDIRFSLSLPEHYTIVHTAPQDGVTRKADEKLVYRGHLTRDAVIGIVFEKSE